MEVLALFKLTLRKFTASMLPLVLRFLGFLKRFSPLLVPLLLIVLIPGVREITHFSIESDTVHPGPIDVSRLAELAQSQPNDVGPAIEMALYGDNSGANTKSWPTFGERLNQLPSRFPQEKWLPAFCANHLLVFASSAKRRTSLLNAARPPLRQTLELGRKREPDNAFWSVALARWEWMSAPRSMIPPQLSQYVGVPFPIVTVAQYDDDPVLRRIATMLLQTRNCTRYDDGEWEGQYALHRTRTRRLHWSLEDQIISFHDAVQRADNTTTYFPALQRLCRQTAGRAKNGVFPLKLSPITAPMDQKSRMDLILALAHIGLLMDEAKQGTIHRGEFWQSVAWTLDVAPFIGKTVIPPARNGWLYLVELGISKGTSNDAAAFIAFARKQGFAQSATQAQAIVSQEAQYNKLRSQYQTKLSHASLSSPNIVEHYVPYTGIFDDAYVPFIFRGLLYCSTFYYTLISLSILWLFFNVYLMGTKGESSSFASRWLSSIAIVGFICGIETMIRRPPSDGLPFSLGLHIATFIGILIVFGSVLLTIRYHRTALIEAAPPDTWNTSLVPPRFVIWLVPAALGAGFTLLALGLIGTRIESSIPTFARSVSVTLPIYGSISGGKSLYLLLYGILSFILAVMYWLFSWRFAWKGWQHTTHSSLRWCKEIVGASICVVAWLYLFVALSTWSARSDAQQLLNERWQKGDWVFIQNHL